MPLVQEMRRSDSLNFQNEKKVVMLRGTKKYAWADVRNSVVTMAGTRPSIRTCQRVYASYNKKLGRRVFKFARCGRKTVESHQRCRGVCGTPATSPSPAVHMHVDDVAEGAEEINGHCLGVLHNPQDLSSPRLQMATPRTKTSGE